jgi:indole-3-glycerol phosphate synthase
LAKRKTEKTNEENQFIGDEYAEEDDSEGQGTTENEMEGLYDLMIPPGIPESVIVELVEEFDLEPVSRAANVDIVEVDAREILMLRGDLETVNEAHDYMIQRMHEVVEEGFKSPWVKD